MRHGFGDIISFDEVLEDIVYITDKDLENVKLYNTDKFTLAKSTFKRDTLFNSTRISYGKSYRKVIFKKMEGSGVVIGQTHKCEGDYIPGSFPNSYSSTNDDYEQSYLKKKNIHTFWIVAIDMNKTVLVPKNI